MAEGASRLAEGFWEALEELVAGSEVVIDRPAGRRHPRSCALVYPLDYGYLQGTEAADGGGVDVWVGSEGSHRVTAVVCTVDLCKMDTELKLLLGCTEEEERVVLQFHNTHRQRAVLLRREG